MRVSRSDWLALAQAIDQSHPPGFARDMARLTYLWGPRVMSRREFVEGCIPIKDKKTQQLIPTRWNRVQRSIEASRIKRVRAGLPERYACLKARQFGVSRYWLQVGIEFVVRDTYAPALIIADEEDNAKKLLEDGKVMCSKMPFALPRKYENRSQLYFGEPIMGWLDIETARATDPARSRTYRFVHATEPGTWKDPQTKIASLNQAVPTAPGTVLSYEGTARGRAGWWYEFWWAAFQGKNDYTALFYPWHYDPSFDYRMDLVEGDLERIMSTLDEEEQALFRDGCTPAQLKWRRHHIRNSLFGDLDLFHQEFPSTPDEAFLTTGRPAFVVPHVLRAMNLAEPPTWKGRIQLGRRDSEDAPREYSLVPDPRGYLSIWQMPVVGRVYCCAADPGDGLQGGDTSAASVLDMETGHQVAEIAGSIPPFEFGKILAALGRLYNGAYLMPEIERNGIAVVEALKEEHYHMIARRPVYDTAGRVIGRKLGWSTNVRSRPLIFNAIRSAMRLDPGDGPKINSLELCREMLDMYIDDSGREDHPSGKHDDRVLAYGIALMARKDAVDAGALIEAEEKMPRTVEERHWREFHMAEKNRDEPDTPKWWEDET